MIVDIRTNENVEDKIIGDDIKYRPSSRKHSGEKDKRMRPLLIKEKQRKCLITKDQ